MFENEMTGITCKKKELFKKINFLITKLKLKIEWEPKCENFYVLLLNCNELIIHDRFVQS